MGVIPPIDITAEQYKTILTLLRQYLPKTTAWVYGSRAKWTSKPHSDLDLVVFAEPEQYRQVGELREAFEESNLPFRVDLFVWNEVPESFREQIEAEYVAFIPKAEKQVVTWGKVKIGEIADVIGGGTPSTKNSDNFGGDIPWLTPKDLSGPHDRYVSRGARNLSQQGLDSCSARLVPAQSVLLSTRAPIGYVALAKNRIATNQGFRNLVLKDGTDSEYLYYWLLQNTKILEQHASGSTFRELSGTSLKEIRFPSPPFLEQRAIAHILGTLDDKIELNQKMNQTLEETAKAIFKSWFVDFDPVRAKAEGRTTGLPPEISDLFPDELVDSEIGKIPKGWEIVSLNSQLSFVLGGDWGKPKFSEETPNKCHCIRGADIANLQSFEIAEMPIRFLKDSSFAKRQLKPWDVVFEISGGSPTQSTGRTVLVTPEIIHNYSLPLATSNFCRLLRFQSKESSLFHYMVFRNAYDRGEYFQYETGTTGIKNFGFKYYSQETLYVFPSQKCLTVFANLVSPLFERSGISMHENVVLSSLRDTFLPKLMSGEIRVPDIERFQETTQ